MQYLLDFLHEHTTDEQLYFVAGCDGGELELQWQRRADSDCWRLRPHSCGGPWELIPRPDLLAVLAARGVEMANVARALHAMVAAQIALADMILSDARRVLGADVVQQVISSNREFVDDLRTAVELMIGTPVARISLVAITGGGALTTARAGHLRPVIASQSE